MAQTILPPGFPLAPVDAVGAPLAMGVRVKVLSVASCLSGLPSADQARLRRHEGTLMVISDIDRHGFVWLATRGESASFCLKPEEVRRA